MRFLQLLVEALLYYLSCSLVARNREEAPGLVRVLITVLLLAFISGGVKGMIGDNFWLASAIIFLINCFILLLGLGLGFFRTIIAAVIVILLRSILEAVFHTGPAPSLFS
jgi:hypothetical protein